MRDELTFNELCQFPNKLLEASKKRCEGVDLLSKEERKKYNYKEIFPKIKSYVEQFKDAKYIYSYSIVDDIKITSTYGITSKANKVNDSVGELVRKNIDKKAWVRDTYNLLLHIAPKLTNQEIIYFVDYFFYGIPEEKLHMKMGVSRNTLRDNIKQSCLVKIWLEYGDIIEQNLK